jgi:KUP system potassium uptake protein
VRRAHTHSTPLGALTLGALGVVYGDIGTSPLYAVKEAFAGSHPLAVSEANVLGIISLMVWALVFVVVVKYMVFVMRASNRGEGGIFALLALLFADRERARPGRAWLLAAGLFGAALLYGDGIITPAISVLSAVEGVEVATPALSRFIVPATIVILVALFAFQKRGTAGVGAVFGPIMVVWFATLLATGVAATIRQPRALAAIDPRHAIEFLAGNGLTGFLALGAVILAVTGAEALYADLGHFGPAPIRLGWYTVVFPALLANYFGQGALLLGDPAAAANPFYGLVPRWGLLPMVALATTATVIASQALITGAFSLSSQAVQLGYLPRLNVVHTSARHSGQIYIPEVNTALGLACVALVLAFRSSSSLAAAYGLAMVGTMAITSLLFFFVARDRWRWHPALAGVLTGAFLTVELSFFGANLAKLTHGGWVSLGVGAIAFTLMTSWKDGRARLGADVEMRGMPFDLLLADIARRQPYRVKGTAVFMTGNPGGVPSTLLHHLKHNKVIHERVVVLSIAKPDRPFVPHQESVELTTLEHGFYRVVVHFGFMETPSVPVVLERCAARGLVMKMEETTFFLGRESLLVGNRRGMARWRKRLFTFMSRNATPPTAYFNIPPNRVVELGVQIEL